MAGHAGARHAEPAAICRTGRGAPAMRCLATAAREAGFDTIVTAHHQDDQAETFLLRLARGSGVYGLAAMPEDGTFEGLRAGAAAARRSARELCARSRRRCGLRDGRRPEQRGSALRSRADARGSCRRLRSSGLTARRLAETAGRLGRAAAALDHYAGALLKERFRADAVRASSAGSAAAIAEAPEEVGLRALALLLKAVGGADYTPPLDRDRGASRRDPGGARGRRLQADAARRRRLSGGRRDRGAPRMGARRAIGDGRSARRDLGLGPPFPGRGAAPLRRPERRAARPLAAPVPRRRGGCGDDPRLAGALRGRLAGRSSRRRFCR